MGVNSEDKSKTALIMYVSCPECGTMIAAVKDMHDLERNNETMLYCEFCDEVFYWFRMIIDISAKSLEEAYKTYNDTFKVLEKKGYNKKGD